MDAFGGAQPHSEPGVTHRGTEGTWPQMGPHLGALRVGRRTGGGSAGGRGSMRSVCLCTDGWLCTPQTRASHSGVHPKHAHMSSAESHSTMNPPPQPSCMADVTASVAQPRHRQLTLCTHTHTHTQTRTTRRASPRARGRGRSGVRVPSQPQRACVGRVLRCLAVSRRPRGREVVGWGCHPPRPPLAALLSPTHAVPRAEPLI